MKSNLHGGFNWNDNAEEFLQKYGFDGSKYSSGRGTVASMYVASRKFSRLRTKSDNLLVVDELSLLMICQFQNYSGCKPLELKRSSSCVYWLD